MQTDEFVIHTPNIKATKFWPGALGVQATHAIVFARLIVAGKDHGVKPFIV
jgi:acyl-CoA oxidase